MSIAFFLVMLLLVVVFVQQWWPLAIAGLLTAFIFVEAVLRRQATRLVTSFTVLLAVIATLYLIYSFFWQIALFGILAAAVFLLWENVRELSG